MPHYALSFEYDGRNFVGTQTQAPGLRTLQSVIDDALKQLDPACAGIRLASRLDAGVSAEALVGDVSIERTWDPTAFAMALNSHLPTDVAVRRLALMSDRWNAMHAAVTKTYRYRILRRLVRPVLDQRAWWVRRMDIPEVLPQLAALLPGDNDLSGFSCLRHDETDEQDPHRRIRSCNWTTTAREGEEELIFSITGEGFLYKQIRGLVGAMVFVAQTRASIDDFKAVIAGGRSAPRLGNIAPAEGLTLINIAYDPTPSWITI